jgi:hypothetical protein
VNYRVLLSPATRGAGIRVVVTTPWSAPPENFQGMRFWRSRLAYDSSTGARPARFNWNLILGLVLMLGVSAGFWTAIGLAVSHVSK